MTPEQTVRETIRRAGAHRQLEWAKELREVARSNRNEPGAAILHAFAEAVRTNAVDLLSGEVEP